MPRVTVRGLAQHTRISVKTLKYDFISFAGTLDIWTWKGGRREEGGGGREGGGTREGGRREGGGRRREGTWRERKRHNIMTVGVVTPD